MLKLRPFEKTDAKYILSWIKDEEAFRKWSADRYETYPAKPEDMIQMYESTDNQYPMTAYDDSGIVGHMTLRVTDDKNSILRFGFVIVDDTKRGMGYGKEMLKLAIWYAQEVLGAAKVTLGVFENNDSAEYCYRAVGFKEMDVAEEYYHVFGQEWKCLEMEYDVHKNIVCT